jgi:RNA polymerase sigma-32 factor
VTSAPCLRGCDTTPLSRAEEEDLVRRFLDGDRAAGRRLVLANLRLVVKIAGDYRVDPTARADLVQEGTLGLLRAVEKYDPSQGARVSTYAAWWIRAYISRWLLENWRLVRIGTTQAQRDVFYRLQRARDRLQRAGVEPSDERLAARFGMTTPELRALEQHVRCAEQSLDAPLGDGREPGAHAPDRRATVRALPRLLRERAGRRLIALARRLLSESGHSGNDQHPA